MLERIENGAHQQAPLSALTIPQMACRRQFSVADGIGLRLVSLSPYCWGKREEVLAASYIPGYTPQPPGAPVAPQLTIIHQESPQPAFFVAENTAMIQDLWRGSPSLDLFHLAYAMERMELLKRNLFPGHSICLGESSHVLVVGPSGTGKTSIMLHLLRQLPCWKLFSANKTVVSLSGAEGMKAVAGTKTISRRAADAESADVGIKYGDRIAFMLPEEKYEPKTDVPIRAIVFARLNDGHNRIEHLCPRSALHRLYPYFFDALNADVVMAGGAGVFMGTPPPGAAEYLAANLARVLKTTPCCSVSGSMDFVAGVIRAAHDAFPPPKGA